MKRICSRLLALVMVLAAIPVTVLAVSDREPNNNMNQAQKFTLFDTISGSITDKDYDWYKFTLDAPGAVTLKMTSYLPYYSVWCFDAEGNELWSQYAMEMDSSLGVRIDRHTIHLTKGTYYLKISGEYYYSGYTLHSIGSYAIDTSFINANSSETEPNNSISSAQYIMLNQKHNGQIAQNDHYDFFRFQMKHDGELTAYIDAYLSHYSIWLYDSNGKELWQKYACEWDADIGERHDAYRFYMPKGTYYLKMSGEYYYSGYTRHSSGNYSFKLSTDNPFTDVPAGCWYEAPVLWALENGVTSGSTETTFSPGDKCLRAHVVTFLWNAEKTPEPTAYTKTFTDVPAGAWYYKPVHWAVEKGITSGTSATKFGAGDVCSRYQVVFFLWKAAGSPEPKTTVNPFTDVNPGHFFYKAVLWAVENGITSGTSATTFGPTAPCNRAQVVTFLYAAYN